MKYLIILLLNSMIFSQNISYYKDDGEEFANIKIDKLIFTCRVAGINNKGEAIILLHGFPETSRMWHKLMGVLKQNNMRIVAPDQRGYSQGARPQNVNDYKIDKLSQDIINIADMFKFEKFHLIGHDWGSAVGWYLITKNPERIISWTALSVPHIDAFFSSMESDKQQQRKSSYISFFKKPILPELYFKIFNYKYLKNIWRKSTNIEVEKYMSVFKQKGAIKASLNWYRANINDKKEFIGDVYSPTLVIYGIKDSAIGEKSVDESEKYLKGEYKIEKLNAGHWLIQESFEEVTAKLLKHIK